MRRQSEAPYSRDEHPIRLAGRALGALGQSMTPRVRRTRKVWAALEHYDTRRDQQGFRDPVLPVQTGTHLARTRSCDCCRQRAAGNGSDHASGTGKIGVTAQP
jgi:hypothetical protein